MAEVLSAIGFYRPQTFCSEGLLVYKFVETMKTALRCFAGRGGVRPNLKKDEIDEQAVRDSMQDYASRHGSQAWVQMGSYAKLSVAKAVNGLELCRLWPLMTVLLSHVPSGCIKLTDMRNVYVRFIAAHPTLWKYLGSEKVLSEHAQDLANSWLTIMAHCRRVVDATRFRQASLGLKPANVQILEQIRNHFAQHAEQAEPELSEDAPEVNLDGLEELLPSQASVDHVQESAEEEPSEKGGSVLKRPSARKHTLKMKRPARSFRRPAAASSSERPTITRAQARAQFPQGCGKCRSRVGCTPSCHAMQGFQFVDA